LKSPSQSIHAPCFGAAAAAHDGPVSDVACFFDSESAEALDVRIFSVFTKQALFVSKKQA
jgi:hypothetical protein